MLDEIRPFFEVVKEGRILYNPKDFTRLNLVASGTFSGDGQERWLEGYDILPGTFKTHIWKGHSSEVRLNLNKLEIPMVQD